MLGSNDTGSAQWSMVKPFQFKMGPANHAEEKKDHLRPEAKGPLKD